MAASWEVNGVVMEASEKVTMETDGDEYKLTIMECQPEQGGAVVMKTSDCSSKGLLTVEGIQYY